MQNPTYTTLLDNTSDELETKLYDEDISTDDLINYMSNAFRSFSDALNVFLINYTDYSGDLSSINERTKYIYAKYQSIGYSINHANIKNWLSGKTPAYTEESKDKMYALCFALDFSLDDTKEFFQKVYFERCFDCHNISESVYYYCIKNHLSYKQAVDIISKISNTSDVNSNNDNLSSTVLYTNIIQQKIDSINTDEELISYINNNSHSFSINHTSAKDTYYDLLSDVQGTREDAKYIEENPKCINDYSNNRPIKALTVLEYYKYNTETNPQLQIYSDEFMINQILDNREHEKNIPKNINLPPQLKSSFPNRHVINDIKLGFEGKKTLKNDSLRKTIILLFFYKYWCEQELGINPIAIYEREETFIAEINDCITSCGFQSLYLGNPYDWIFIFSSKCENPLDEFRNIYKSLLDYEVE